MTIGICFVCGKRLVDVLGRPVTPVVQEYHGNEIKMHQVCAKSHAQTTSTITAAVPVPTNRLDDHEQ